MATRLNFTNVSTVSEENSHVEVRDEMGNALLVPSKGIADYKEYQAVMTIIAKSQGSAQSIASFEIDIVLCCLRYRLELAPSVPGDEILQMPDGSPITIGLIKALFDLFKKELGLEALFDMSAQMQQQVAPKMSFEDASPYIQDKPPSKGFGRAKRAS